MNTTVFCSLSSFLRCFVLVVPFILLFSVQPSRVADAAQTSTSPRGVKTEYRIGAILPNLTTSYLQRWKFSREFVDPAIQLSLELVHGTGGGGLGGLLQQTAGPVGGLHRYLPPGVRLVVSYKDSRCDAAYSMNSAFEYFINNSVSFFCIF